MYDARQIANWFIARAQRDGRKLSIMSILKLVYISHGWHLEMRDTPLFMNKIEAWQRGPVVPDVYYAFRRQGVHVSSLDERHPAELTSFDEDFLEQIYGIYGSMSPFTLSDMTHEPNGPWEIATKRGGYFSPLSDEDIRAHYAQKRKSAA